MAKASTAADEATTPEVAPAAAPEPTSEPASVTNWRYVGDLERVYVDVPVTANRGDVIAWPRVPSEDGNWQPTADSVTKRPDNYRTEGV